MTNKIFILGLITCILFVIGTACQQKEKEEDKLLINNITQQLLEARSTNTTITPISNEQKDLSLKQAYAVQVKLADELSKSFGPVTGYKLAYADSNSLKNNNIDGPAYGPIFRDQIKQSGDTIAAKDYHNFSVENEIVFKIARVIDKKINRVEELIPYVKSVHIGFDMSEGIFKSKATIVDLVINGLGSKYFVLSEGLDPSDTDVSDVLLRVTRKDSVVYQGPSDNVFGNPWYALKDVANDLAERGLPLKANDVIFSGKVAPAYKIKSDKAEGIYKGTGEPFAEIHIVVE